LERACWQDELWQDRKNDSKIPPISEKKIRTTFEKMEGFNFVTPVTGLNRPNTGQEDDDADHFIGGGRTRLCKIPHTQIACKWIGEPLYQWLKLP
jgi:hypothetical protein